MRLKHLFIASVLAVAGLVSAPAPSVVEAQSKFELRCGWFSNPTPGNAWLIDKNGEWTIGVQGGYQADGDWPDLSGRQWIETNVHYGYGCACIRASFDRKAERVIEIKSAYGRPLSTCRNDRALRRKEPK
ncbi:MAG TPA: DUF4087 domain-containing protein [Pyrinomonadaceae bacterium]|nr:DUF4087 domain-containing protein [Pyrinomonadaceae bacterium]